MKTTFAAVLALSLAVMFGAPSSQACSCLGSPPEELYANYDAVFRGSTQSYVISNEFGAPIYIHSFLVTACWKGNVQGVIPVHALVDEAGCGVFISPIWDVIVYANLHDGHYHANLCSVFYVESDLGQEHLDWLGEPGCSPVSVEENSWGSVKALYR
jgi:hypothetical protein